MWLSQCAASIYCYRASLKPSSLNACVYPHLSAGLCKEWRVNRKPETHKTSIIKGLWWWMRSTSPLFDILWRYLVSSDVSLLPWKIHARGEGTREDSQTTYVPLITCAFLSVYYSTTIPLLLLLYLLVTTPSPPPPPLMIQGAIIWHEQVNIYTDLHTNTHKIKHAIDD